MDNFGTENVDASHPIKWRRFELSARSALAKPTLSSSPHSNHYVLYFDVITPQDGHIVRNSMSPIRGRNFAKTFE